MHNIWALNSDSQTGMIKRTISPKVNTLLFLSHNDASSCCTVKVYHQSQRQCSGQNGLRFISPANKNFDCSYNSIFEPNAQRRQMQLTVLHSLAKILQCVK